MHFPYQSGRLLYRANYRAESKQQFLKGGGAGGHRRQVGMVTRYRWSYVTIAPPTGLERTHTWCKRIKAGTKAEWLGRKRFVEGAGGNRGDGLARRTRLEMFANGRTCDRMTISTEGDLTGPRLKRLSIRSGLNSFTSRFTLFRRPWPGHSRNRAVVFCMVVLTASQLLSTPAFSRSQVSSLATDNSSSLSVVA